MDHAPVMAYRARPRDAELEALRVRVAELEAREAARHALLPFGADCPACGHAVRAHCRSYRQPRWWWPFGPRVESMRGKCRDHVFGSGCGRVYYTRTKEDETP